MTEPEHRFAMEQAWDEAMRRLDGTAAMVEFRDRCMRSIIGAAYLLDRDPESLAELFADGRLARYITAAESTLPLPLDDPRPVVENIEAVMRRAADALDEERKRLERKLQKSLRLLADEADSLRHRANRDRSWQCSWRNAESWPPVACPRVRRGADHDLAPEP